MLCLHFMQPSIHLQVAMIDAAPNIKQNEQIKLCFLTLLRVAGAFKQICIQIGHSI